MTKRTMRLREMDPLKIDWRGDRPMARKCGDCRACCVAPPINEPGRLEKPVATACEHLCKDGGGCSLFGEPERPRVCGAFACNWLRGDGGPNQRPDRMRAMPVLARDRSQCALYLAPGLTPETMTHEAVKYVRRWLRKRKTAVLILHGDKYELTRAVFPDGTMTDTTTKFHDPSKEKNEDASDQA